MSTANNPEHDKLIEVLKFTPCTYKISMWGYGSEIVMGTVDRKIYDYFKSRRLDLSDFAWDSDYADDNNIPEEMWPFPPGSWYECDGMAHASGVDRNAGTLQIDDENGDTVYECSLESLSGDEDEPEMSCNDEVFIGSKPDGTVVFIGRSNEKGTFFESEIELKEPFDITKLSLGYDEIDSEEIINFVEYDGEQIDNWGGSTSGKSSDFGFYIAGSNKATGKFEKYTNMDDIEYAMTEWFPKKIKPVRLGNYLVKTAGKNSYTYQCKWTGSRWISTWQEDKPDTEEVKIKEWQGLAEDPDYVDEMLSQWPYVEQDFSVDANTYWAPQTIEEAPEVPDTLTHEDKVQLVKELEAEVLAEQAQGAKWPFSTGADTTKE